MANVDFTELTKNVQTSYVYTATPNGQKWLVFKSNLWPQWVGRKYLAFDKLSTVAEHNVLGNDKKDVEKAIESYEKDFPVFGDSPYSSSYGLKWRIHNYGTSAWWAFPFEINEKLESTTQLDKATKIEGATEDEVKKKIEAADTARIAKVNAAAAQKSKEETERNLLFGGIAVVAVLGAAALLMRRSSR